MEYGIFPDQGLNQSVYLALQSRFLNTGPSERSILFLLSHLHVYIKNGFLVDSIWLSLFFNIKSDVCLLIGVLRLFTSNLIISMVGFHSTILSVVFCLFHLFFVLISIFFLSALGLFLMT